MTLDRANLQGNILRGYPFCHAAYLFVNLRTAAAGRRLLGELFDPVTTEQEWDDPPPWTLGVAITAAGLKALDLDERTLKSFPAEFRCGMAARAVDLGDIGPSAPKHWEDGLGTGRAHLLLTIHAQAPEERRDQVARWKERVESDAGLAMAGDEHLADKLPDAREHFGFADGFSQPAIEGTNRPAKGEGVKRRLGGWRKLRLGEFVLGHRDEDGVVPARDSPLLCDGTFMVWRKLEQNVALYRRWVLEAAHDDPPGRDLLEAKIVGRWPNGDSLVRSPDGHDPGKGRNQFGYAEDPRGLRCPVGAHVRRANPRDGLGWRTERTRRHRLLRRGMPYGPLLPPGVTEPDEHERGLIFVCLNASIARQFELVQTHWLNDGDAFGLGPERDLLTSTAPHTGKFALNGDPPRFLPTPEPFVRTRGGEYLFVPSMSTLRALAAG